MVNANLATVSVMLGVNFSAQIQAQGVLRKWSEKDLLFYSSQCPINRMLLDLESDYTKTCIVVRVMC